MEKLTREEIIEIAAKLISCGYETEEEADRAVMKLKSGVADPKITDYLFFEGLSPEEAADKALSYKPIIL